MENKGYLSLRDIRFVAKEGMSFREARNARKMGMSPAELKKIQMRDPDARLDSAWRAAEEGERVKPFDAVEINGITQVPISIYGRNRFHSSARHAQEIIDNAVLLAKSSNRPVQVYSMMEDGKRDVQYTIGSQNDERAASDAFELTDGESLRIA